MPGRNPLLVYSPVGWVGRHCAQCAPRCYTGAKRMGGSQSDRPGDRSKAISPRRTRVESIASRAFEPGNRRTTRSIARPPPVEKTSGWQRHARTRTVALEHSVAPRDERIKGSSRFLPSSFFPSGHLGRADGPRTSPAPRASLVSARRRFSAPRCFRFGGAKPAPAAARGTSLRASSRAVRLPPPPPPPSPLPRGLPRVPRRTLRARASSPLHGRARVPTGRRVSARALGAAPPARARVPDALEGRRRAPRGVFLPRARGDRREEGARRDRDRARPRRRDHPRAAQGQARGDAEARGGRASRGGGRGGDPTRSAGAPRRKSSPLRGMPDVVRVFFCFFSPSRRAPPSAAELRLALALVLALALALLPPPPPPLTSP